MRHVEKFQISENIDMPWVTSPAYGALKDARKIRRWQRHEVGEADPAILAMTAQWRRRWLI